LAITGALLLSSGINIMGLTGAILTISSVLAPSGVLSTIGSREIPFTTAYFSTLFATVIGSGVAPVLNLYANIVRVYDSLTVDRLFPSSIGSSSLPVIASYFTAIYVNTIGNASNYVSSAFVSTFTSIDAYTRTVRVTNPLNNVNPSLLSCIGYSSPYSTNMYQIGSSSSTDINMFQTSQMGFLVVYTSGSTFGYAGSTGGTNHIMYIGGFTATQQGFNCGTFDAASTGKFTAAYNGYYYFDNMFTCTNASTFTVQMYADTSMHGEQMLGTAIRPGANADWGSYKYTIYMPAGAWIRFRINVTGTVYPYILNFLANSAATYSRLQIYRL